VQTAQNAHKMRAVKSTCMGHYYRNFVGNNISPISASAGNTTVLVIFCNLCLDRPTSIAILLTSVSQIGLHMLEVTITEPTPTSSYTKLNSW